jgi:hypothetical protein
MQSPWARFHGEVIPRCPLLHDGAYNHVIDLFTRYVGASHGMGNGVDTERLSLGIGEGAAICLSDRRTDR